MKNMFICKVAMSLFFLLVISLSSPLNQALAQQPPEPLVAIHVSELTQALETMPAVSPTPNGPEFSGHQWWYTAWHYFVAHESLQESLRSDGTPFVVVSDADIAAGKLRNADGSPRYPILISLAAEAIATNEISPLRDYVTAGGFLFVGSSSFTRNPDGTYRADCALASEMGLRRANTTLTESNNWNWYQNSHFARTSNHRLVSHIPNGTLNWNMPVTADEIPWGIMPEDPPVSPSYTWQVVANGATVLANGDAGPLLTVKPYGLGQIIFHGPIQPLIGHGVTEPSMYAYFIYRKAIEWAFESFRLPIVKVSPWRYSHDAALLIRHDEETYIDRIKAIKSSAQFESSVGAVADYYFCTGALRTYAGADRATIISGLRDAVSLYGATIGSHNGGLGNPDYTVGPSSYYYWHWGPDEALDQSPQGYANGKAYAAASILASFQDLEGWLAGLDNGRAGCGATGNCPRTWVAPFFNATREGSKDVLEQLGSITAGEEKIGPFPHFSLSYTTPGKRFAHLSLPASDWYVGTTIPAALDMGHTSMSINSSVDFYHGIGGLLLNFYGHMPSNNGSLQQQYVTYSMSKPNLWSANAVALYDWWRSRSRVNVTPTIAIANGVYTVTAAVSGTTDPDTSIEMVMPRISGQSVANLNVFLDGMLADSSNYRTTSYGTKIKVGSSVSTVNVQYTLGGTNLPPVAGNDSYRTDMNSTLTLPPPGVLSNDTDPEGRTLTAQLMNTTSHGALSLNADGSFTYTPADNYTGSDSFTYVAKDGTNSSNTATVTVTVTVVPPAALSSLSVTPASVVGGTTSQGTITLTGPAPSGGIVVSLNDNSSAASVPATVTIPAGNTSAAFTITTTPVASSAPVTISAGYGGVTKTAIVTVLPPSLSSLSLNPTTVTGGASSIGTVRLNGPAPNGGIVVALSDNSSAASVQPTVTVPSGSTSAIFTVSTIQVQRQTWVTISAGYRGVTKTATLRVTR